MFITYYLEDELSKGIYNGNEIGVGGGEGVIDVASVHPFRGHPFSKGQFDGYNVRKQGKWE